ncbi:MAG: hypothetical protein K0M56_07780 [Kaistella sp.]|nr:hypothetical protein [Kaistella sp.]
MTNFQINFSGSISELFLNKGIRDFKSACNFIANLPYRRNSAKSNIYCVLEESAGTCSTKHLTLRKLALENNHEEVKLLTGIFKMDAEYSVLIKNTLEEKHLSYIPEAHNYLEIEGQYYDFTKRRSTYNDFKNKLILEKETEYDRIIEEKTALHQNFLKEWISMKNIPYTFEEIWDIREKCIQDLQFNIRK